MQTSRGRNVIIPAFMGTMAPPEPGAMSAALAKYEPVIGLEVHVQLKTRPRSSAPARRASAIRRTRNTCPVCLGLPGALPVLNRRALELAIRASLALQSATCRSISRFARKNYFYPDLPKGYQISHVRVAAGALRGWLEIDHDGARKRIGITRLHLEEDAAKNLHEGFPTPTEAATWITTAAARRWPKSFPSPTCARPTEAHAYLTALKQVLRVHRSQRLQHGGRLAALRRQRQRAPARRGKIRHQSRSEESEFLPLPAARAGI